MCDNALLNAAKVDENNFQFDNVFENAKQIWDDSNLVIANFETVLGGKPPWRAIGSIFNTPDDFAKAIKNAGIDVLLTANNHAYDGGIAGVRRTKKVLEDLGFDVVGTLDNRQPLVKDVEGISLAILAYTEDVNFVTDEDDKDSVISGSINLLAPLPNKRQLKLQKKEMYKGFKGKIKYILRQMINSKALKPVKKAYSDYRIKNKKVTLGSRTDTLKSRHTDSDMLKKLEEELMLAKQSSDLVIVNGHCGGQLNKSPGEYVRYITEFYKKRGADCFIGNHPHVIQEASFDESFLSTASIGSVTQTPDGEYRDNPLKPYYSMMVNVYYDKQSKSISKTTFSFIRAIADEKRYVYLYDVEKLYNERTDMRDEIEEDVKQLYMTVTGKKLEGQDIIRREYQL